MRRLSALVLLLASCRGAASPGWLEPVEELPLPAATGARFPRFTAGPVLSWLEPGDGGGFALRFAAWAGEGFGPARTAGAGVDWMINWADFPSVLRREDGGWAAHWLVQRPGAPHAYDVRLATSADGDVWSSPVAPYADATPAEHGFVSLLDGDGGLHAIWLDGRAAADGRGATALRATTIDRGGGRPGPELELDPRVCDCCQTDVARTAEGPVVAYRDRGPDEVRDVAVVRFTDGAWSAPTTVHADGWRIAGCPVNGPAVAARGRDVAVAWFTAPDEPRVRLAFSRDAGRSFAAPIEVATGATAGRVDVVLLDDGRAVVSWLADGPDGAALLARPFRPDGPAGAAVTIARTELARGSGFPQLALAGDRRLLFAWTDATEPPRVRVAAARLR